MKLIIIANIKDNNNAICYNEYFAVGKTPFVTVKWQNDKMQLEMFSLDFKIQEHSWH